MRMYAVTAFMTANIALEGFVFFSAFQTAYRSYQIMQARQGLLQPTDILKIYARKFVRLAPVYYMFWFILWAI